MRIVNRNEFLRLPPNTIYCKYRPYILGSLHIKGATSHGDFYTTDISTQVDCNNMGRDYLIVLDSVEGGGETRMRFDMAYRDGLYDECQLFAVWDDGDISGLIDRLRECV